jgi:uncharacterized protein (TIGR02453 family)
MNSMATHFSPETLKFLRGLKRNNDRAWFEARREIFERAVKAPMLTLIDEVNHAMAGFAPEYIRPAPKVMMRIYRDTRFAKDKRPYKHHVSAWWARRGMEKTSGGGFYLQVSPEEVMISAGCYMPERDQLLAIRRWMAEHHTEFRALQKKVLRPRKGEPAPMTIVDSAALTRMPKGFASDHPANELLRAKTWGVHMILPGEAAMDASLLREIVAGFRRATPLVDTLNAAIDAHDPTQTIGARRSGNLNAMF